MESNYVGGTKKNQFHGRQRKKNHPYCSKRKVITAEEGRVLQTKQKKSCASFPSSCVTPDHTPISTGEGAARGKNRYFAPKKQPEEGEGVWGLPVYACLHVILHHTQFTSASRYYRKKNVTIHVGKTRKNGQLDGTYAGITPRYNQHKLNRNTRGNFPSLTGPDLLKCSTSSRPPSECL